MGEAARAMPSQVHDAKVSVFARDKRRFRRIALAIHGRFLDANSEEHAMVTEDISCAGAQIITPHRPTIGDPVVLYFDDLGRIAGRVVRYTEKGFGAVFQVTPRKQDRIVDRLIWLWNKDRLELEDERTTPRYATGGAALVTLSDGRTLQCTVMDISVTGAGLEAMTQAPFVGEVVTIGNLKARVLRSEGRSFGLRFIGRVEEDTDL